MTDSHSRQDLTVSTALPTGQIGDPNRVNSLKFHKSRRIRQSREFDHIYAQKRRALDGRLMIFGSKSDQPLTRIGLSVSRKNGNSVVRHHLRRRLKEAFRVSQKEIPEGLDLILIPVAGTRNASFEQLCQSLIQLSQRLKRELSAISSSKREKR